MFLQRFPRLVIFSPSGGFHPQLRQNRLKTERSASLVRERRHRPRTAVTTGACAMATLALSRAGTSSPRPALSSTTSSCSWLFIWLMSSGTRQARLDCGRSTAHSQGTAFTPKRYPHSVGTTECGYRQNFMHRRLGSSCGAPTVSALFAPRSRRPLVSHSIDGRRALPWRLCACGWQL